MLIAFLVHHTALHDEEGMLQQSDVLDRVTINGDHISELALLNASNPVRPAQQIGSVDGSGLDGLQRSHAKLYIDFKFVSVEAVWINRCIRSQSDLHTGAYGFTHILAHGRGDGLHLFG